MEATRICQQSALVPTSQGRQGSWAPNVHNRWEIVALGAPRAEQRWSLPQTTWGKSSMCYRQAVTIYNLKKERK